jgi:hypothetical protein
MGVGRPATVIEPGHVRVTVDVGLRVSPAAVDDQEAAAIAGRRVETVACTPGGTAPFCPNERQWRTFVESAAAGMSSSPGTGEGGLAVRYGLRPGWDAGLRLGTSALRAEVAHQFLGDPLNGQDSGVTALAGAALSHNWRLVDQPLVFIEVEDFGRDEVDLFVLGGYRHYRDVYLTLGARYTLSYLRAELIPTTEVVTQEGQSAADRLPDTEVSGLVHHVGGVASAFLGIGGAYLGFEIAAGLDVSSIKALGEEITLSAMSVRPALIFFLEI